MSALPESPRRRAIREFESLKCPACGAVKRPRSSFCSRCLYKLPDSVRNDLRPRDDTEFALAHEDAREWLEDEQRRAV